jgi:hypothetical protein
MQLSDYNLKKDSLTWSQFSQSDSQIIDHLRMSFAVIETAAVKMSFF